MGTTNKYTINIRGLEEISKHSINPTSTIVIGGHPGAGKTTLATAICKDNMERGHKCLYISFQEEKDRLYMIMRGIGIDLNYYENIELFKFVRLPITLEPDVLMSTLNSLILEFTPNIVVIDSITPIIESVDTSSRKRALVQNYLYNLSKTINGVIILLAELEFGDDKLQLGNISFVSDILILLKYKLERGLMIREMEIKKARGAPVRLAQIPFAITSKGFRTFPPPSPQQIKVGESGKYQLSFPILKDYIGNISSGENFLMVCEPDARSTLSIYILLDILATNNLKGLIVTYRYGAGEGKELIARALGTTGLSTNEATRIMDKHLEVMSVNPSGMSMIELLAYETMLVEEKRPDVLMYHGIDVFNSIVNQQSYFNELLNQMFTLKKMGIVVARYMNNVDDTFYRRNAALSDFIIKGKFTDKCGEKYLDNFGLCFYAWRRGRKPRFITESEAFSPVNLSNLRELLLRSIERE
ncbi:MAG: hypothetical protein F7B60_05910 [Desulfurococcales archaeon]|nr:hypothetical protein [Desulfurococcales archaeon]